MINLNSSLFQFIGDDAYDFTTPVTGDITLTAKWKGKDLKLKIYKQDGSTYKEFTDAETGAYEWQYSSQTLTKVQDSGNTEG